MTPTPAPAPAPDRAFAIQARGLAKSYAGRGRAGPRTEAVRGVNLDVPTGDSFAFLGPNGAGKTTTIAMLCALALPTAGRAWVAGADVVAAPRRVRQQAGVVFQSSALDADMTARQNLYIHARLYGLSRRHARERVAEVLELAGATGRPRQPVRTYSGGMRRRLEIARGLLHAPRVLFLDEPTAGLDPHARKQIWRHLRELRARERTTLFVTTHYLDEAEHCDRIAIIDGGRIVASGAPAALKAGIGRDQLYLRTSDDAAAAELVERTPELRGALTAGHGPAAADGGLTLRVRDASGWIPRLCEALARGGVTVHAAAASPPTLDDVFFHHTGRTIAGPAADAA